MRDVYKKYVKEGEETEELPSLGESPVYKKIRSQ